MTDDSYVPAAARPYLAERPIRRFRLRARHLCPLAPGWVRPSWRAGIPLPANGSWARCGGTLITGHRRATPPTTSPCCTVRSAILLPSSLAGGIGHARPYQQRPRGQARLEGGEAALRCHPVGQASQRGGLSSRSGSRLSVTGCTTAKPSIRCGATPPWIGTSGNRNQQGWGESNAVPCDRPRPFRPSIDLRPVDTVDTGSGIEERA